MQEEERKEQGKEYKDIRRNGHNEELKYYIKRQWILIKVLEMKVRYMNMKKIRKENENEYAGEL